MKKQKKEKEKDQERPKPTLLFKLPVCEWCWMSPTLVRLCLVRHHSLNNQDLRTPAKMIRLCQRCRLSPANNTVTWRFASYGDHGAPMKPKYFIVDRNPKGQQEMIQ